MISQARLPQQMIHLYHMPVLILFLNDYDYVIYLDVLDQFEVKVLKVGY